MNASYLSDLQKLFDKLAKDADLKGVQDIAIKKLLDIVLNSVKTKGDKIIIDSDVLELMRTFNKNAIKLITEDVEFKKLVASLESNINELWDFTEKQTKVKLPIIRKIATNEFISDLTESGLNEKFISPVRKMIYANVSQQQSKTSLINDFQSRAKNDDFFGRYIKTNAELAAGSYTGSVNKELYINNKSLITHIGVIGTLIETSAPQCRMCLINYKKRVPIKDFKNIILPLAQDNGLIEKTNIDNVFTNRLHWGCRHIFTPLIL